ncbi:MAG: hypothetical protein KIT17_01050 [Rubrivivax sp.]|nr:hypothetical protein [Rubrivivax sp.]
MTTEPKTVQLEPHTQANRAHTEHTIDTLRKTPPPQDGGTLTTQIECGNSVARVYHHPENDDYAFTVSFARKAGDGLTAESPRLCAADLADLRRVTKAASEAMKAGIHDGVARRLREDRWTARDAQQTSRRGR